MTVQLAIAISDAIAVLDKRAFGNAEHHRLAAAAANDPLAYDFSTGWPQG
ncbi:hypothetical protein [Jeongeupia naejangsanensis]|uniref:DUF4376 domain-containing protein n=1 Tax=Jeongeupia naejangsanensis TaxID=613195 RepID=A0ABS2BHA9_9NEIS|nr:hypothetical protein [Jeongeupia naejangsanensis]MBM3115005.1 hypothetical protein [Jeongeupia naejangsanensis]